MRADHRARVLQLLEVVAVRLEVHLVEEEGDRDLLVPDDVEGDRVGVLNTAAQVYVKEGGLSTGWVHEVNGAKALVLAGTRVGVVTTADSAYVKDGGLSASWVHEADGVAHLALAGDRVGIVEGVHRGPLYGNRAPEMAGRDGPKRRICKSAT